MKQGKGFSGDLYRVINIRKESDSKTEVVIHLLSEHKIFGGHFPGNPVLPGACTVQIIKETIEAVTGQLLLLTDAPVIKFQSFINPEIYNDLDIDLTISRSEVGRLNCSAVVRRGDASFCTFRGTFRYLDEVY